MNPSKSISSIILPSIGVLLVAVVIYGYSRVQANALAVDTANQTVTQVTPEQIAVATSSAIVDPLPEPTTPVVIPVPTPTPVPTPVPTPAPVPTPLPSTAYKNGTYKASASYSTPKVPETINVTLTITNDIVTNATVIEKAISQDSRHYQKTFEANYKAYVVGKHIDSIQLSRVSGSSLTTQGFNSALATIKSQARI